MRFVQILLILLCLYSEAFAQYAFKNKWDEWAFLNGSSSMLNVVNRRYLDPGAKITEVQVKSAMESPGRYIPPVLSSKQLGVSEYDLTQVIENEDKEDPIFARGSKTTNRIKWRDLIFNRIFQVSLARKPGTLLIFHTGAKHCSDFFLRNLAVTKEEPKLQNVIYVGQSFIPGDQLGSEEFANLLEDQGGSGKDYRLMDASKAFLIDEQSFMALLVRYYWFQDYHPSFKDLSQSKQVKPEIICFADLHNSMKKSQVWQGFPDAKTLQAKGIRRIEIHYEGLPKEDGVVGPESLWRAVYLDEKRTTVKNAEKFSLMNKMIELQKQGMEITLQSLADR